MSDPVELFLVSAACLITAAWLLRAWRRRAHHRALDAAPGGGTFLSELGITARLRDFYRLAAELEADGAALYGRMAGRSETPSSAELCRELAKAETEHRQRFLSALGAWRTLPPNQADWPRLREAARRAGLFADEPPREASEQDLARYALRQEVLSIKFYESFRTAFPDAWRRSKMETLVNEERSHEAKLRAAYPAL
jgi:rubrerythrin